MLPKAVTYSDCLARSCFCSCFTATVDVVVVVAAAVPAVIERRSCL